MIADGGRIDAGVARGELTFRQLAHFVAVAEEGAISAAADRLQFSPSAISASVTELERALRTQLCVRRRAQGVTLTAAGSVVLAQAKRLLADAAELRFSVQGRDGELVGPLVVGCFVTLAPALLPKILDDFEGEHPGVETDFIVADQDELRARLLAGEIDAALMYDVGGLGGLHRLTLYEPRGYALFGAGNPMAAQPTVSLRDLAELPLVLYDQSPSTRYAMLMFEAQGLTPRVRYTTHSFELTRSIVARSDHAYAVLVQRPRNNRSYEDLPIVEKEIVPAPPKVPVVFAWAKDVAPNARVIALRQTVSRIFGEGSPEPSPSV